MSQETVLVTGSNGYVGLHVVHQCLAEGWNVIGMVRSENAARRLKSIFPDAAASSRLSIALVSDITAQENYKPAFRVEDHTQVTAVINTASPLINNPQNVRTQVLDPAIRSGTALLEAVQRFGGGSVRRVVHTSSCGAVLDFTAGLAPRKVYTAEDWNPATYEQAAEGDAGMAYLASKALAERSLWTWISDHKSASFDFVSIVPSALVGPHYFGALEKEETLDLENLNASSQMMRAVISSTAPPTPYNEPAHLGIWSDVRTAAAALVAAVATPAAGGKRIICAQRCHWQLVRDTAREALPEMKDRIDIGTPGAAEEARNTTYDIDGTALTKVLGVEYESMENSLRDTFVQLVEAERK